MVFHQPLDVSSPKELSSTMVSRCPRHAMEIIRLRQGGNTAYAYSFPYMYFSRVSAWYAIGTFSIFRSSLVCWPSEKTNGSLKYRMSRFLDRVCELVVSLRVAGAVACTRPMSLP